VGFIPRVNSWAFSLIMCKDLGLGTPRVRGRVRVKSHVFIALCLRLAVALANHHRGNDVASPTITL
ncbi:hypothetical protein DP107_19495, partial [Haloglomus irregulare]